MDPSLPSRLRADYLLALLALRRQLGRPGRSQTPLPLPATERQHSKHLCASVFALFAKFN